MKGYDIAVFLIFLMFSINIIASSGIFGNDVGIYFGADMANIQSDLEGMAPRQSEELSYPELAISSFGLLVRSLVAVLLILLYSTVLLPVFLFMLGLPAVITAPITFGVWLAYVIGYNQYRGRSSLLGTE